MAVKNINDQPVKTPTYLWGVDEVGLACRATPYVSPVLSVVGLTGEITQAGLRAALGLGTAAYINVASTGNASAAEIVKGNDTRLSDARTPVAHTHAAANISDSTVTGRAVLTATDQAAARTAIGAGTSSTYNVAASGNAASGEVVKGDDTRLTDARNPTSHSHIAADVTDLGTAATEDVGVANGVAPLGADAKVPSEYLPAASGFDGDYNSLTNKPTLGTSAALNVATSGDAATGEVVKGNDSRLTNARTPSAHTHVATDISDSSSVGRGVLTAVDAAAARAVLEVGSGGGGLAAPVTISTNTTLTSNAIYKYTLPNLTFDLPASPANGDVVVIINAGTSLNSTVGRNGKTIMGAAENMTLNMPKKTFVFTYCSAEGDWTLS